jgi:hypothetical protein
MFANVENLSAYHKSNQTVKALDWYFVKLDEIQLGKVSQEQCQSSFLKGGTSYTWCLSVMTKLNYIGTI